MALNQSRSSKSDFSSYRNLLLIPAIVLGACAQFVLSSGSTGLAMALFGCAIALTGCGVLRVDFHPFAIPTATINQIPVKSIVLAGVAILSGTLTFAVSTHNRFSIVGVLGWVISIVAWWFAWVDKPEIQWSAIPPALRHPGRLITLACLIVILSIGAYFRFASLTTNPLDMNSDHAEKLLDVHDVLDGNPYIFFERNTGREPFQFYWTVALVGLLNIPPDFMALKIGTALIGWLMLPAVYLLAREAIDTRTALVATLFAAVASWGVITSRFGLRYPLAPCAVAWTLYFLVRSLKRNSRNSMLVAGLCVGIGLLGYTAYRFMLVVVPLVVAVWMVWTARQHRTDLTRSTLVNGLFAAILCALVLMPLLRYGIDHPDELFYRASTRISNTERDITGNVVTIFAKNAKNVLLMFNLTHDEVWVANLPDRPAVDTILGALLVIGSVGALTLTWRQRSPLPALILASGVLMLLPSALSIAFPRENPSVVRTGGALPMFMIVCAIVPANLINKQWQSIGSQSSGRFRALMAWAVVAIVCFYVITANYQRVFVDYPDQYCQRAQNANDIASEMRQWISTGNTRANAWIIGYPHWVDSRAVGIWIGDINFANTAGTSIGRQDAAEVNLYGRPGWFALNESDIQSLQSLKKRYLAGSSRLVTGSQCSEKRFIIFTTN